MSRVYFPCIATFFLATLIAAGCSMSGSDNAGDYHPGGAEYYGDAGASYDEGRSAPRADPGAAEDNDSTVPPEPVEDTSVNPFVDTAHDPFSTFAADVDSASYDIFRQYMESGQLPPAETVRLEEYVNYFDYDYEAPSLDAEVPFAISLSTARHPLRDQSVVFRVGIQAAAPSGEERPSGNIVFLVDVSGSMSSAGKLDLVQRLLVSSLDHLQDDDVISIVTYAGSTEVRLSPTPVRESETITSVIESLSSGGGTAGASGIALAYEQAQAGFIEGGINRSSSAPTGISTSAPRAMMSSSRSSKKSVEAA